MAKRGRRQPTPKPEELCQEGYAADKIFRKILEHPKDHKSFEVQNGLIDYTPNSEIQMRCIPHSEFQGRKITELVLDQVHRTVGHMGPSITKKYAWHYFWWLSLGSNIKTFCKSCATCQAIKTSNQQPQGLLHSLPIPTTPWSSVRMDFVGPFPLAEDVDYIWVHSVEVMVYQYDKLFGYGWWMTSILTITHIFYFWGTLNFPVGCHGNQFKYYSTPKVYNKILKCGLWLEY